MHRAPIRESWICIVLGTAFLTIAVDQPAKETSDWTFSPSSQYIHVAVTLTITGVRLSTSDLVAIATTCNADIEKDSLTLLGGEPHRFSHLSLDGDLGRVAFSLREANPSCLVCIKFKLSRKWFRVGSTTFDSKYPVVDSAWTGAIDSTRSGETVALNSGERMQLFLSGGGLVKGIDRLAFKFASARGLCASPSHSLIEPQELAAAYNEGTKAVLSVIIVQSDPVDPVMCIASNSTNFLEIKSVQFTFFARYARNFSGAVTIAPSITATFTIKGENFEKNAPIFVKVDRSCEGMSAFSEIEGGNGVSAKFVDSSRAEARFRLIPISGAIYSVNVVASGVGYQNGILIPRGGDGSFFSGAFSIGPLGSIASAYITSPGEHYRKDPVLDLAYTENGSCSNDINGGNCSMTGSVVAVIKGFGLTRGCFTETVEIVGVGGGGSGFQAAIINDETGQIVGFNILNHGHGYTHPPQLIVKYYAYIGACRCGSVFFNGQPTTASLLSGTVPGNMDPCFTASIASGGFVAVSDSGWRRRENLKLCARTGTLAQWSQVGNTTISIQQAATAAFFSPTLANSFDPFLLTVSGTGFEQTGSAQTKIKLTRDCSDFSYEDSVSSISGGEGKSCELLQMNADGTEQVCIIGFTVAAAFTTQLKVCRRIGAGQYMAISASNLTISPFTVVSFLPTTFQSASISKLTVFGSNFGQTSLTSIKLRGCSKYLCDQGMDSANNGEPCGGMGDNKTCMGGSRCVERKKFRNSSANFANLSEGGCLLVGGDATSPSSVGGCLRQNSSCSYLVFSFSFLSIADVIGDLSWSFGAGNFQSLGSSSFTLNGSKILKTTGIPSVVKSLSAFSFSVQGFNIDTVGFATAKFKFINASDCTLGNNNDIDFSVLGGSGRSLTELRTMGTEVLTGQLSFRLIAPEQFQSILVDWRIDPKFQSSRLCWKIGSFLYRDVNAGVTITLETTRIVGYSPSDGMTGLSSGFILRDQQIPTFKSNEILTVTVAGRNIGDLQHGIMIRPIPMSFALESGTSQQCVTSTTTKSTRASTCKEFPITEEDPFGGAADICQAGSSINAVLKQDEKPISVISSTVTVPSSNTYLAGVSVDRVDYASFSFKRTMLRAGTRFMLCWKAVTFDSQNSSSAWQPIGNLVSRQAVFQTYFVFSVHTFVLSGAYILSVEPSILISNQPIRLSIRGVGVRCNDTEIKIKLTTGNTFQSALGRPIGKGCTSSTYSDSDESLDGSRAVFAVCQDPSNNNDEFQVLTAHFPKITAEFETKLEVCWSMAYGDILYDNIFLSTNRTSVAKITVLPSFLKSFQINNAQPSEQVIYPHTKLSVTMAGHGLNAFGADSLNVKISEDCDVENATIPGGEARPASCVFNFTSATAEFVLKSSSSLVKLCAESRQSYVVWMDHLDGYKCDPQLCGAPVCTSGNYILDSFQCDRVCCQETCAADENCSYYTWYEIPSRVYRRCQLSSDCNSFSPPVNTITIPHVLQKTRYLLKSWVQVGPSFIVSDPKIQYATPQARPSPVSGTTFIVNLQGNGMGSENMQVHVKLVSKKLFDGGCNNISAKHENIAKFEALLAQKAAALDYRDYLKNLNMNGTCDGGKKNCQGGPAPPLTVCSSDSDCWGPSGAAGGGQCVGPNTGFSCLWNSECTNAGFCNNSLAYLTLTPLPNIPEIRLSYSDVFDDYTVDGGYGRFVQPKNSTFASVPFLVYSTEEVVFCVAFRDSYKEDFYLRDGYVTDLRLISSLYGYTAVTSFSIKSPAILEIFPDHISTNARTVFSVGGFGFSPWDRLKLVYARAGCTSHGLSYDEAESFGIAFGTKSCNFEVINSLKTNATVSFSILASEGSEDWGLVLCYAFYGTESDGFYQAVGNITIVNKPPIITSFTPKSIYSFEATKFSIMGTGLGGAQKLKLVQPGSSCRGSDLDEALSDIYGLAPGSMHSLLELDYARQFEVLDNPKFSDAVFLMRMSVVFQVNLHLTLASSLELCIAYSDSFPDPEQNVTSGYHSIGMISWNQPKVINVLTESIESGTSSRIVLLGQGLSTSLISYLKLIESYSLCNESETSTVLGGSTRTLEISYNSSALEAFFLIPSGVSTTAIVCHRFGEKATGIASDWNAVGKIDIRLPRPLYIAVVSPVSRVLDAGVHETSNEQAIIVGEPFSIIAKFSQMKVSNFLVKMIPSTFSCQGQDAFSDIFEGGQGQLVNFEGMVKLEQGIRIPAGLSLPLRAKVCIFHEGAIGYEDSFPESTWEIMEPYIDSISPVMISSDQPIFMKLKGRGIATATVPSFISSASNLSCLDTIEEVQVQSDDGGEGITASLLLSSMSNVTYQVSIALCWLLEGKVIPLRYVVVYPSPKVLAIIPSRFWLGNRTAFLLTGVGLNTNIIVKFNALDLGCTGFADVTNCNYFNENNERSECIKTDYTDQEGLTLLSRPKAFLQSGSMQLCLALAWGSPFQDSGLNVSVELWTSVHVLADSESEHQGLSSKTDIQRVEARMSDDIPPCTRFWRSNYMLLSQTDSVDRESPFIYTIDGDMKCWASCNLVPLGYSQTGLCPSGVDLNLISPFQGVPMDLTLVGGLELEDQIFISNWCGDDLTRPSLTLKQDFVVGGEPITLSASHRLDVTKLMCNKTQASLDLNITGLQSRVFGWKINFSLARVSKPGDFHRLCVLKKHHAVAFSVPGISIKVQPPKVFSAEPSTIWAGRNVSIRLNGAGLSSKDRIRIIDGETVLSCYHNDSTSSLPGSFTAELNEHTDLFHSYVFVKFDIPSTHARICYMYNGSSEWEDMTRLLSLRTSGYVYGYESTTHFLYGEAIHFQNDSNWIGGTNQTISVLAPLPVKIREKFVYSRTLHFELAIDGYGLTQSTHIAIMPAAMQCGGHVAPRINIIQNTDSLKSPLRTVPGGETRHPTFFVNDGESGHDILASCSGSTQMDSCSVGNDSIIQASYGSFEIGGIGKARVCVMTKYTSEFVEIGEIDILRPCITSLSPTSKILLNHHFLLNITGFGLNSSDLLKIVDGTTCYGIISSRPYFVSINVQDPPYNYTAMANMTITGSLGLKKVCYSYDSGLSFVDTGLSLQVTIPKIYSVFPTVVSMSAERRITLHGDAVLDGDQVKIIYSDRYCEYSTDSDSVFGGQARPLQVVNQLPEEISATFWPTPAKSGSAVFLLPRLDPGVFCYKPRGVAGWVTVRSEQGDPVTVTVLDAEDIAFGLPSAGKALAPQVAWQVQSIPWMLLVTAMECFHGRF